MSGTYDIAKIKNQLTEWQTKYATGTPIGTAIANLLDTISKATPTKNKKQKSGETKAVPVKDPVSHVTKKLAEAENALKTAKQEYDKVHKAAKKIHKEYKKIKDAIDKAGKITKISKHQKNQESTDATPSKASKK